ncbi:MAG: M48 family metalloprotease [Thermoleophilia bacterium]|nr:M48 family metalloprotease [Thermoleophilia bacterium]
MSATVGAREAGGAGGTTGAGGGGGRGVTTRPTVFAVQREQRWRIWLLFALLVLMALVSVWVVAFLATAAVALTFGDPDAWSVFFSVRAVGILLFVALAASAVYWFAAQVGAKGRLLEAMHCRPLERTDRYHRRLADVVEEMRLATGAPRIECVTVATLGMNAFAFSDLRGGGVIGVTEGALARLSRQQLQAVVAHEFAHVLSGSYVTATVSCLLFGIYSSLADALDALIAGGVDDRSTHGSGSGVGGLVIVGAFFLRVWVWVLGLASQVANAALARERERQADVAAARFTGDPLSLAEALRMIARHPGGAGFVPPGLAPLCIRAGETAGGGLLGRWGDTHPPIGERINALLLLANVAPSDFERQAAAAAERLTAKEHVRRPPASPAATDGVAPLAGIEALAPVLDQIGVAPLAALDTPEGRARRGVATPRLGPPPLAGWTPLCPACGSALREADYEGVRLHACRACGGRLVGGQGVRRVCARREVAFSDEQRHLTELLVAQSDHLRRGAVLGRGRYAAELVACPECGRTMMRRHYSYEHAVEVDVCTVCDLYWFERDELEVLQLLHERQVDRRPG